MPYIKAYDGLRALAIIGVLIFHVNPEYLPGGFMGVDVFFVLSGFLITSKIFNDIEQNKFTLTGFYLGRIQRLLPNILLTVIAVLVLWEIYFPASTVRQIANQSIWTLFNGANIYIWKYLGGYWGDSAKDSPLTHAWSLGIEEQFYIIFPFILLSIKRFTPSSKAVALSVLFLMSLAASIYGSYHFQEATFYLLPTRAWELLLGAIFGIHSYYKKETNVKNNKYIGHIGIILILISFIFASEKNIFPGWISLLPVFGTAFLIKAIFNDQSFLSFLLSSRLAVLIGKVSFSLYLWHWPMIILFKNLANVYGFQKNHGSLMGAFVSVVLSSFAYAYVENPLRKRDKFKNYKLVIILICFGGVITYSIIIAFRPLNADPQNVFATPQMSGILYDCGGVYENKLKDSSKFYDISFPDYNSNKQSTWENGGIIKRYGGDLPTVVVMGSSHALMYSKTIDEICKSNKISISFYGMDYGTRALFNNFPNGRLINQLEADKYDDIRKYFIRAWHPSALFVIDRWDSYLENQAYMTEDKLISEIIKFLDDVTPFVETIYIVSQIPVLDTGDNINIREYVSKYHRNSGVFPVINPDSRDGFRINIKNKIDALTSRYPNLRILKVDEKFYNDDGSVLYKTGREFFLCR